MSEVALVEKLFIKHSPAIRGYLLALHPDVHVVDDLMHAVFLCVTGKAEEYQVDRSFVAWARGIARIELLRLSRQQQRLPLLLSPEVIENLSASVPDLEPSDQRMAAMTDCLEKLSPRAKQAITFRYLEGLMPGEIASRMAVAVQSIHVTLSRARVALRKCIEQKLRQEEGA